MQKGTDFVEWPSDDCCIMHTWILNLTLEIWALKALEQDGVKLRPTKYVFFKREHQAPLGTYGVW